MNAAGIIAEYNPLHNGHAFHMREARLSGRDDIVVAMSGDYVQRGEPAVVDKFLRTEAALRAGADVVIGLPAIFSAASAEYFARSGVSALISTGIVDTLCFGSESGDLAGLSAAADYMLSLEKDRPGFVRDGNRGKSYAHTVGSASTVGGLDTSSRPNDMLAVEYIKAIKRFQSDIAPMAVPRAGPGHSDLTVSGEYASASAIRRVMTDGRYDEVRAAIPGAMAEILHRAQRFVCLDDYSVLLHNTLIYNSDMLSEIRGMTEGLHNRIIAMARGRTKISEITDAVKTKRYVRTAIQRAILNTILGIRGGGAARFGHMPPYLRVLGFRREKERLLREIINKSNVPVIVNLKKDSENLRAVNPVAYDALMADIRASELYCAVAGMPGSEYSRKVVII